MRCRKMTLTPAVTLYTSQTKEVQVKRSKILAGFQYSIINTVVRTIEYIQKTGMQRKSGAKNGSNHYIIVERTAFAQEFETVRALVFFIVVREQAVYICLLYTSYYIIRLAVYHIASAIYH